MYPREKVAWFDGRRSDPYKSLSVMQIGFPASSWFPILTRSRSSSPRGDLSCIRRKFISGRSSVFTLSSNSVVTGTPSNDPRVLKNWSYLLIPMLQVLYESLSR